MAVSTPPRFEKRRLEEWLELAEQGYIALPSFQRSYVWKRNQAIADYLLAVFDNRPTGVFLVLKTNGEPQFPSRTLRGINADAEEAQELLLDGQQRLTSLWHAFNGTAAVSFYVSVESFAVKEVTVCDIVFSSDRSATGKARKDPRKAHQENLVPVAILRDIAAGDDDLGPIWEWCEKAVDGANAARRLEKSIQSIRNRVLMQRDLHYCELEVDTDKDAAIDIFVQSNKSSVKVNEFDIAVALALEEGEENLRERIEDFHQASDVTRHYFKSSDEDDESVIAPLGEWLLFAACLSLRGAAPKKQRFEAVIKDLFKNRNGKAEEQLDSLLKNIELALNTLADHGAPTRNTLPALPPLHVLASLQDELEERAQSGVDRNQDTNSLGLCLAIVPDRALRSASEQPTVRKTTKDLRGYIKELRETGTFGAGREPPIFDDKEYALPNRETLSSLERPVPWIKGTRLGRAIAALVTHENPTDWVTDEKLDTGGIRRFENAGKLDRHHVFPRNVLAGNSRERPLPRAQWRTAQQAREPSAGQQRPEGIPALDSQAAEATDGGGAATQSGIAPRAYDVITAEGSVRSDTRHSSKLGQHWSPRGSVSWRLCPVPGA